MPGYAGPFCKACPIATYSPDYGYGDCLACENKPENAIYTQSAVSSLKCPYECTDLEVRERAEHNPDCLDPISLEYEKIGGSFSFFAILIIFLWASLIIFVSIS